jgi:hypothetical protein
MTSWRTGTSQPVQDDLDALVTLGVDHAQRLLTKYGEFFPFGVNMSDEGQDGFFDALPGLDEHPESHEVLDLLYEGATAAKDYWRAIAIIGRVTGNGTDAVCVLAEHRDAATALVFTMPYTRKGIFRKSVIYGPTTTESGERLVYTD